MSAAAVCPECGGAQAGDRGCEEHFHQLLFWENQYPALGEVHHLTVLCYHLQHPHYYSPAGLEYALGLLVDFVQRGVSPAEIRRHRQAQVNSSSRAWTIRGQLGAWGKYARPQTWSLTVQQIAASGPDNYVKNVRLWAQAVLTDLAAAGNLPHDPSAT